MVQFVDLAGRIKYANGTYFGPRAEVAKLAAAQTKWDATVNANKSSGTPPKSSPNHALVESVVTGVAEGKSPEQIAKEQGLTRAQLDAQLAASGFQLTKDVNKNRETQSTQIINRQTGEVVSGYYENHDAGTRTSQTIDDKGAKVVRTEAKDGTVTEIVTDTDGVETKTTTEPINDGKPIEYEVQPGDNLSDIAADHGIGLKDLQESNPALFEDPRDPDLIYAGETVVIEDGTRTTVEITKDGRTVTIQSHGSEADVARKAIFEDGATVEQVAQAQGMTSDEVLEMLEAAGIWIDKVEPMPGNGDVETIRIADPSTNLMVIESYDYQHDAATRTVIDERSIFDVPATDPKTGEVAVTKVPGASGYLQNEVAKSAGLANSQIESSQDLIAQAQKRDPDAIQGLRAEQKDAELDMKIAGGKADSFTAAMQEAEADRLVAAAYDLVERSAPGTEAHNGAQAILGQALDYAGRVANYADAVDANRTLLDAEKNLRANDATRQQAGADLQKAFSAYKEEFLWGNVTPETRAQYERDGVLPGGYTSEAEVDKLLWDGFEDTLKQGEPAIFQHEGKAADLYRDWYKSWRAYNQANDGAMQARVDYTDGAIAKADADLEFLRGEIEYLKGLQDQWVNSNPGHEPSTSPYQQSIDATQTQIQALSGQRGKLVNDEGYLHDKYMLTVPLHKRDLPQELSDVEFEYAKSHAQDNSAEIQNLQGRLGGPIVGRDDDLVLDMVTTMVTAMGPGGANVDIEKVVTQILRSPQINGDDPDHAGDLTIRPIAMGYFEAGVQTPTGLFEVRNRDGETHYVDLTGKVFDSKDEFLDDNVQFSENGILVMPKGLGTGKGADGSINYEAVQALYVSGWDRVVEPIIAGGAAIASIASFVPVLAPVAAPIALAGGAYFGTRAAMAQVDYLDNGGSWGDRESVVNMLSVATTALPIVAGGMRGFALRGADGMSGGRAFAGGLGMTRLSGTGLGSFGRYGRMLPTQSELSSAMLSLDGIPAKAAWLMDAAAVGGGTVLIGDTVDQLAAYGRGTADMSGLDLANAIVGLGTGIYGTAAGVRGLRSSKPFGSSAAHSGSDASSVPSELKVAGDVAPTDHPPITTHEVAVANMKGEPIARNRPIAAEAVASPEPPSPSLLRSEDEATRRSADHTRPDEQPVTHVKDLNVESFGHHIPFASKYEERAARASEALAALKAAKRAFSPVKSQWSNAKAHLKNLKEQAERELFAGEITPDRAARLQQAEQRVAELRSHYEDGNGARMQAEDDYFEARAIELLGWSVPELSGEGRFLNGQAIDWKPSNTHANPDGHASVFSNMFFAIEAKNNRNYSDTAFTRLVEQINSRDPHLPAARYKRHVVVVNASFARGADNQLIFAQDLNRLTDGKVNVEDVFFLKDIEKSPKIRSATDGVDGYGQPSYENLTPPEGVASSGDRRTPQQLPRADEPTRREHASRDGSGNKPQNLSAAFHLEGSELPRDPNAPTIPAALRSTEEKFGKKPAPIEPAVKRALQENLIRGPDHLAMRTDPFTLDPNQILWSKAALTHEQLEALTLSEVESLGEPQISAVPGGQMGLVSPGKFRRFTPRQFTWMSGQWDSLSVQQLVAFRKTHQRQMTSDQKAMVDLVLQSARARELHSAMEIFNPMVGSSYMLWHSLPPDWLATAAGVSFAWRGLAFITQSLFPQATAPHTKLGRFLNGANGISFIATSPGSAAPFLEAGANPQVNGTFTLGNTIFGTKSTLDSISARSNLGFAGDYVGNIAYLGGSAFYAMHNLGSPLATAAGTIFSIGSAEFLASAIRKNKTYGREVPRTDEEVAAATKLDTRWAAWDRIALGVTFGLGMGLFAYDSLDDLWSGEPNPDDEASKNGGTSAPVDASRGPDRQEHVGQYSQLVVTSDDGLNLRTSPKETSEIAAVLQPDTFVRQTGQPVVGGGRSWVPVEGFAPDGSRHQGWVAGEYTMLHPEGARTSQGRVNPKLEQSGFEWVEARTGQTLGSIARGFERDTAETVMLNLDHIVNPARLFEGDRIYLPVG